jgi:von Willebrand factor type A domain
MKPRTLSIGILACALGLAAVGVALGDRSKPPASAAVAPTPGVGDGRIQIALLLDTSGSMDGLIGQARSQLWKVVNEYARATRNGHHARLEIALYQYGTDLLPAEAGYMRQVLPFTSDLDRVSEALFELTVRGSSEYCGEAIQKATFELGWSQAPGDLRVVFIAGNEPFDQGPVEYHTAIAQARARGIRVNTIHCGGDEPSWRDAASMARGEFLMIDQNQVVAHVAAPQDDEIARLGLELNATYVAYGALGRAGLERQAAQDQNAASDRGALLARSYWKANGSYDNATWDLVDAARNGTDLAGLPDDALPVEMRGLDAVGRKAFVERKQAERARLQKRIQELTAAREEFIAAEQARQGGTAQATLDAAMIKVAHDQGTQAGFRFE